MPRNKKAPGCFWVPGGQRTPLLIRERLDAPRGHIHVAASASILLTRSSAIAALAGCLRAKSQFRGPQEVCPVANSPMQAHRDRVRDSDNRCSVVVGRKIRQSPARVNVDFSRSSAKILKRLLAAQLGGWGRLRADSQHDPRDATPTTPLRDLGPPRRSRPAARGFA
jgi:hypothetical protein